MPDPIQVTLTSLLKPVSVASAYETVLELFRGFGFKVTSWGNGGIGRTVSRYLADMTSQHSQIVPLIAASGFLDLASGTWLSLLAKSVFDEDRNPATYAVFDLVLESSAAANPWPIGPGGLWVKTATGKRFNSTNTEEVTLESGAGETLTIEVKAESPGTAHNTGDSSITILDTPQPGVTIQSSTQTTQGTDAETDSALKQRCRDKWATLGDTEASGSTLAGFRYWAITADPQITRAYVDGSNPDGPGTVRVYIAGPEGEITSQDVIDAASAAVIEHKAAGAPDPTTQSATDVTCVLTGTIYYDSAYQAADVQAAVEAALDEFFREEPIGGTEIDGTKQIWQDFIKRWLQGNDGDGNARVPGLTLPLLTSGDFTIAPTEVPKPNYAALTYTLA